MSIKIDVRQILKEHIKSLSYSDGRVRLLDLLTFFGLPLICAVFFVFKGWVLNNNVLGTFVNLGSIFSALLISVLVMIFDQSQKMTARLKELPQGTDPNFRKLLSGKRDGMSELFANTAYAIVVSILLVFSALGYQLISAENVSFNKLHWFAKYFLTPLNIILVLNLLFTVLMVIKRTYIMMSDA